jgi:integrase/recombinase XerD
MAVTVKVLLKKNKLNSEGEYPVYLRITKDRISRFQAIGINVKELYWDEKERKVKRGHPNSVRVNHMIAQRVAEIQAKALDWELNHKSIRNKNLRKELTTVSQASFTEYFDAYIQRLLAGRKMGTHDKALAVYSKLHAYTKSDNILFQDIDLEFLKRYDNYLSDVLGNRVNTIHSNLKMLRKLFNDAVREELIAYQTNPFIRYKLTTEKSDKQYLTEEEVAAIDELDLSSRPRLNDTKQMFIFACYAGGIRVSDLLQLKWKDFNGTHLSFTQQKTKEQISVKLPGLALEILRYYKKITGPDLPNYIFPFLRNDILEEGVFDAISSQTAYLNKNLKEIASLAGIDKNLSMHVSRHTWATRALRKGISIDKVSKLMGHGSIKTTQVYAKIVNTELDKAMDLFDE